MKKIFELFIYLVIIIFIVILIISGKRASELEFKPPPPSITEYSDGTHEQEKALENHSAFDGMKQGD